MKKELISVENLDAFICRQDGKLYVGKNRILTPGAKDELARRKVSVVYGEEPAPAEPVQAPCRGGCGAGKTFFVGPEEGAGLASAGSLESLSMAVAHMLRTQYGVTDPNEVRAMTVEALKTIRDNI
ncbi:hypothetical protein [Mailhella massiliensis]|uniref:Uncharacterized protein n=1 Tax=Mailhella massiliensis TaxID=1903261 RepID=A0A921AU73_9BACT|nr:hypothetical protein [Mailhella massiliensis]HJD96435.1 hypothetical protein [Mailhella massiliensis]